MEIGAVEVADANLTGKNAKGGKDGTKASSEKGSKGSPSKGDGKSRNNRKGDPNKPNGKESHVQFAAQSRAKVTPLTRVSLMLVPTQKVTEEKKTHTHTHTHRSLQTMAP